MSQVSYLAVSDEPLLKRLQEVETGTLLRAPADVHLWMLVVAALDPTACGYRIRDIAAVFGHKPHTITTWVRQLFPRDRGRKREVYYLDFRQVVILVRRVCREGRRLPDKDVLYHHLRKKRAITAQFPHDHIPVKIAVQYLEQQKKALLN